MLKNITKLLSLIVIGTSLTPSISLAAVEQGDFFFAPKNHLEIAVSYDSLSPHNNYGDWKSTSFSLYRKEKPDFTWFAQTSSFTRGQANGLLGSVGAYKDWNDALYTFTSISAGSKTDYLPKIRVDHDFNYKFGAKKNFVGTVGGTVINYHGDHKDFIFSTGISGYLDKLIVGYRIFRNQSEPGSVISYSQQYSLSYGQEKHQWTTATYSFGKQAYMATSLLTPEAISSSSKSITLNHRKWLSSDHGYVAEINRFKLENGYNKTGLSLAYFHDY